MRKTPKSVNRKWKGAREVTQTCADGFLRPADCRGSNRFGFLHPAQEKNTVFGRSVTSRRTVLRGMLVLWGRQAVKILRISSAISTSVFFFAKASSLSNRLRA